LPRERLNESRELREGGDRPLEIEKGRGSLSVDSRIPQLDGTVKGKITGKEIRGLIGRQSLSSGGLVVRNLGEGGTRSLGGGGDYPAQKKNSFIASGQPRYERRPKLGKGRIWGE